MKNLILFSIALFTTSLAFSQKDKTEYELTDNVLSLDLLAPGVAYETKISSYNSIFTALNAGFAYYSNSNGESGSSWLMVPVLTAQYRHYYNYDKRINKGKTTWFNSANYFGFNVTYQTEPIAGNEEDFIYESGAMIGPMWGLQRNGTLTFNFSLGYGYYTGTSEASSFGNLKVGVNLTKLSKK